VIAICGVAVGDAATVGAGCVALGNAVGGIDVAVAGLVADGDIGDTGNVNVAIADAVGVIGVKLATGVIDGVMDAVGVMNSGLPNSRHPRSGAAPVNPVMGVGGINSPSFAVY